VKQQQRFDQLRCRAAYDRQFDGYVCRNPDGTLIDPDQIVNVFSDRLERHGLRRILFYDLRHSCVTLLHSLGIPLKDIQLWVGHASLNTTANIYAHVLYKDKLEMVNRLGTALGKKRVLG
jgi:integrase